MVFSLRSSPLYLALFANSLSFAHASNAKVATAWFAGWHSLSNSTPVFDVSNISWDKYSKLTYSFAETTEDPGQLSLEGSNPDKLPEFVEAAHQHNVSASVSIGGWAGSVWWSVAVGSPENRTTFVKTVTDLATQYDLDGLDFDWEYPNRQGLGCNILNDNDTSNLLEFLKELKADPVGSQLGLSAAVSITPFVGADGNPSTDVSEFAHYLDYIAIMNYDIWGSWSTGVGPNAPLNDTCAEPANQQGSAVFAVNQWTKAGFPVEQIVLGVPGYGHSFVVNKTAAYVNGSTELAAYPAFDKEVSPLGDSWDTDGGKLDKCGVMQSNGGNWDFWAVVQAGFLDQEGKPVDGVPYRFDDCSKTPFVYDDQNEIMISFDNPDSFTAKGEFIADMGLAGFAMWEAGGDYNDLLIDAIRDAAGFETDEDCY